MFDHYIGLDWAQTNMAIARMTKISNKVQVVDVNSSIGDLVDYLKNLKGSKILTFEETNTSQWLYTELRGYVDEIFICDPYRNKLLSEGAKTDKIDATKLVKLLRSDMLKPVYHTNDQFIYLRTLVSGYEDTIKAYVRAVNQRKAIFRSIGKTHKEDKLDGASELFVVKGLDSQIDFLQEDRKRYEEEFSKLCRKFKIMRNLKSIPGIGEISAVKLVARIVDIGRFESVGRLWSYFGLIKYEKMSGRRSYGKRSPRYCRNMKAVICGCTTLAVQKNRTNPLKKRFDYLMKEKSYSEYQARIATRRLLASIIFGVMKSNKKFDPRRIKHTATN